MPHALSFSFSQQPPCNTKRPLLLVVSCLVSFNWPFFTRWKNTNNSFRYWHWLSHTGWQNRRSKNKALSTRPTKRRPSEVKQDSCPTRFLFLSPSNLPATQRGLYLESSVLRWQKKLRQYRVPVKMPFTINRPMTRPRYKYRKKMF